MFITYQWLHLATPFDGWLANHLENAIAGRQRCGIELVNQPPKRPIEWRKRLDGSELPAIGTVQERFGFHRAIRTRHAHPDIHADGDRSPDATAFRRAGETRPHILQKRHGTLVENLNAQA